MNNKVTQSDVYAKAKHSLIEIEKLQDSEDCLFPGFAYLDGLRQGIGMTVDRMECGLMEPSKAYDEIIEYYQLALHREMA